MPEALLHRGQHIDVAASLDEDHPVRVQAGEMEPGREQVAPAQAPENRSSHSREDTGEKYGGCCIVRQLGTARKLVKRTRRDAAARELRINRGDVERQCRVANGHALDSRDTRSKIVKDAGLRHGIKETRTVEVFLLCSI